MHENSFRAAFFAEMADAGSIAALFDHLPGVHFLLKDANGRFVAANASARERLGAKCEADFVGATDDDFVSRTSAQDYRRDDRRVMRSGEPLLDRLEAWRDRRGRLQWFLTTKLPVMGKRGGAIGVAAVIRPYEERLTSAAIHDAAGILKILRGGLLRLRTPADLAAAAGLSERTLHRRIQAAFGVSPRELILRARVEAAGERLASTSDPIAAVAVDLGFCDQSALTRHFRDRTGTTPGRFRRRFRSKQR